jgi:hypothetical protein
MRRPIAVSIAVGLVAVAIMGCGSVHHLSDARQAASSGASQKSGGNPAPGGSGPAANPDTNDPVGPAVPIQPVALVFVIKPGADPVAVGHRIAAAQGAVTPAQQPARDSMPEFVATQTYVVVPTAGHEQEALQAAQTDPDVERAFLKLLGALPVKAQNQ